MRIDPMILKILFIIRFLLNVQRSGAAALAVVACTDLFGLLRRKLKPPSNDARDGDVLVQLIPA